MAILKLIKFTVNGDYSDTLTFLKKNKSFNFKEYLNIIGKKGVEALETATPKDTGKTSRSWKFKIENRSKSLNIIWYNTNIVDDTIIAVILQYGHLTRRGNFIEGQDYINPALKPVFDKILEDLESYQNGSQKGV